MTEIRLRDGGAELVVKSPSSPARTVADADIVAILLPAWRIVVGGSVAARDDAGRVAAVGGIRRMPAQHPPRIAAPPEEAA